MYSNAKYYDPLNSGNPCTIQVEIGGVTSFVPMDPANTDYANIMQLVSEGKLTIAPAE
jgi:hypothetical protein